MKGRAGLFVAIVAGALAISLDFASVDLALPALESQFKLDLNSVQWVINGYVVAFAVLLVGGGRLADTFGRKRIFLAGLAIFGLASLVGGMGWSGGSVIAFRVLQGVGAALLWPAMIAIACSAVSEANRGFAVGVVMGTCSIGNAAGPIVGGALTQWLSWRWVLWINVPMALVAMAITLKALEKDPPRSAREGMDWLGMSILSGGLVALMIGVDQAPAWGWGDARTIGLLVLGTALLVAFPLVERRVANPLVPLELMGNAEFMTLCVAAIGLCQFFFVMLLYLPQYAMKFQGDSAMHAGARVAPFMAGFGLLSFYGGTLYARVGARRLLLAGLAATALGALALAAIGPSGNAWLVNVTLLVLGLGIGAAIPTLGTRAVEVAGIERAGLASGVTFMFQLAGAAVLFAVATTLFTASSRAALADDLARGRIVLREESREAAEGLLVGPATARTVALPRGPIMAEVVEAARGAYSVGIRTVLAVSAAFVFATLLLVIRFVRGTDIARRRSGAPPTAPVAAPPRAGADQPVPPRSTQKAV